SRHDQTFNFVNCDISGIRNFSISREGLGGIELVQGILNLKHTDFHNNGQLSVSDRQKLVITGDAENYCHFYDNQATPIYATEAAVELNYVWVGEENNLNYGGNNGAGIYLFDGDGYGSSISNSVFQGNNGIGVKLNNPNLKFINNQVIDNNSYGMLCYDGTVFYGHEGFKNITLSDNGSAEYASWQNTYRMANINANINITESNFGNGADNYSAMIIAWDGVRPVNVQGTNLTSNVLPHLFPSDANAWVFNRAPTRPETLLIDASNDIVEGNTAVATTTLKQIIAEYSTTDEAASAVYYLYHLNNCDENNFKSLRNYLETITPIIDTPLYKAQKSIIAKCYMKDEDYLSAINMLEEIIQDSQVNDDVIAAMIEQDYNYYKLSQINERSLPTSRSIETLQDYQDRVRELEAQFSFNQKVESNFLEQLPNEIITSNYPNPFNPTTTISYNLPADGNVEISIFNLKGQRVKRLQNDFRTAGNHSVVWDGCDERGNQTSSSVYFYRIKTAKLSTTKKILMMK
ncbi:MAG: T9SS type A sorting domain-containing protein, partial [Candidatus Cloacimonadales bacterium]